MRPPITPQKIWCFQLIAFMFIPLAFSMDCQNKADTKQWSLFAVCWETSGKASEPCRWANPPFKGRRQDFVYGTTNITESHRASLVLYHCSAFLELPLSSGHYNYYIFFAASPTSARKAVELRIDDPEKPILQDCPTKANEGDTIKCKCRTAKTGNPPPVLSWKGLTSSATLRLADVRREHSKTYTCEMIWGNQTKTVSFSLLVLEAEEEGKHLEEDAATGIEQTETCDTATTSGQFSSSVSLGQRRRDAQLEQPGSDSGDCDAVFDQPESTKRRRGRERHYVELASDYHDRIKKHGGGRKAAHRKWTSDECAAVKEHFAKFIMKHEKTYLVKLILKK